jgi:hypothetical protein
LVLSYLIFFVQERPVYIASLYGFQFQKLSRTTSTLPATVFYPILKFLILDLKESGQIKPYSHKRHVEKPSLSEVDTTPVSKRLLQTLCEKSWLRIF